MSNLSGLVRKFSGVKVAVLGDLVADVYITGTTSRISREAPVLIVREESRELRPGGAANVVANLHALGGVPVPVGLLGDDGPGVQLLETFASRGISCRQIVVDPARFTTTKTRVLAGGQNTVRQQMLRLDRLCDGPADPEIQEELVKNLRQAIEGAAALVVSDYGEGVLGDRIMDEVRKLVQQRRTPVFADSRTRIQEFAGADALTPNEPELVGSTGVELSNEARLEKAGRLLLDRTRCRAVLVKRGRNGMALFLPGEKTVSIPAFGLAEVADVTGAGDTVIAAFALASAVGASALEAMQLANTAGGIKVTKSGTAAVEAAELVRAIEANP